MIEQEVGGVGLDANDVCTITSAFMLNTHIDVCFPPYVPAHLSAHSH